MFVGPRQIGNGERTHKGQVTTSDRSVVEGCKVIYFRVRLRIGFGSFACTSWR